MNKITKLGVSALCGSLAAVSAANAGDLTVSGGADLSWQSMDDESQGGPIGIGSNYGLAGSGELDNGWTVDLGINMKNKNIYSNTDVTVTVPALGAFIISNGVSGTGIDRMDDVTPNVWEEAYASGLSTGFSTVYGGSGGTGIEYTPNMMPDGLTARLHWSPDAAGSKSNDKSYSGTGTDAAVVGGSGGDDRASQHPRLPSLATFALPGPGTLEHPVTDPDRFAARPKTLNARLLNAKPRPTSSR